MVVVGRGQLVLGSGTVSRSGSRRKRNKMQKGMKNFFLFLFFVIFPLLFRFSRDFLLLRAETNSARMANRVGKVFL